MSRARTIGCSERIREELRKRGLTLAEVSRHIGFSSNYLNCCVRKHRISVTAAKLLEVEYRIKPEAYAEEPKKERAEDMNASVVKGFGVFQKFVTIMQILETNQEHLEQKIDRLIAEWEGTK